MNYKNLINLLLCFFSFQFLIAQEECKLIPIYPTILSMEAIPTLDSNSTAFKYYQRTNMFGDIGCYHENHLITVGTDIDFPNYLVKINGVELTKFNSDSLWLESKNVTVIFNQYFIEIPIFPEFKVIHIIYVEPKYLENLNMLIVYSNNIYEP